MQQKNSAKINIAFLVTLCLIGASVRWADAQQCQTCMTNSAYCVNTTHFHPCYFDNAPTLEDTFECDGTKVCTNHNDICVEQSLVSSTPGVDSVCEIGNTGPCGTCATGVKRFACVSKTQYALCAGTTPQPGAKSCGPNEVCSRTYLEDTGNICVPECVANNLQKYLPTCTNDETTPKPTSPAPPTTPINVVGLPAHCAAKCAAESYCYTSNLNSADCKSYLYCEKVGTTWEFVIIPCPSNQNWDDVNKECSTATCVPPPSTGA